MSKIKLSHTTHHRSALNFIRLKKLFLATCISLGLASFEVSAKENQSDTNLSIEQVLERVRTYQQSQGILLTQQDIANSNLKNSKLWKNPTLNVERAGFKNNQDQELSLGISQPLDIFGERKASRQLANIANDQVGLQERIYDEQLKVAVKYLWSQVVLAEIETELLLEQLKVSQESLNIADKRYQAGSIAQVDVDRVRLTHTGNIKLIQESKLKLEIARRQLANAWGKAAVEESVGRDIHSFWPEKTLEKVNTNLQDNLQEKTLKIQLLEAQANVDLLKAQARPNPDLNVSMKRTKTPQDQTDNQLTVGVSIPLNIFNRNQHSVEITQAKTRLLQKQQDFYGAQNALEVQTLLTEFHGLKEQFDLVVKKQIPLAVNVQKRTFQGFSAGKFNVMDVQQATEQLHEVRLQSVQILKSAWQKSIEAESLSLGVEPSLVMSSDALFQINQSLIKDTNALPVIGMGN